MKSKFGFLVNFEILQTFASKLVANVNPAIIHNVEKYLALKKVHYLSIIEDIDGDYLEFGVYTGSSFCHSIRCYQKLKYLNSKTSKTRFFGFDSFSGFGEINEDDKHPFYNDDNFKTDLRKVNKRVKKVAKNTEWKLIAGYFDETLKNGPEKYGIKKSSIIFIDSDTYSSSKEAFNFCDSTIQIGTFILLDDYYSYKGSNNKGVKKAFDEFVLRNKIKLRRVFTYGMGGSVFVVSEKY